MDNKEAAGHMGSTADTTMRRWLIRVEGVATIATVAGALLLSAVALMTDGWAAAGSVALGAGAVLVFFALGAWIDALALRRANPMSGIVVLGSYAIRLALLTVVAGWLATTPWLASVTWFGVGVAAAAVVWVAGMIAGHATGRWPIYDTAGVLA